MRENNLLKIDGVIELCVCIYIMMMCIDILFFFKQKTAYELRISDWSSDVCSSDLNGAIVARRRPGVLRDHADGIRKSARSLQIGRASCRDRVCQYVKISVVGVSLTQIINTNILA